jgi:cytochrome P450
MSSGSRTSSGLTGTPDNLLYGHGIHACPGAPLARLELRVMLDELLSATTAIETVPGKEPVHATDPGGGYNTLPLLVRRGPQRP